MDAVAVDAAAPPAPPRADEVLIPASPKLPAFYLDREETTIGGYNECIAAGACTATSRRAELGKDPRVSIGGVTFDQARAYCAWRGKRLPSPDEWRRAAYGDDARKFPWGDAPPTCDRVWMKSCKDGNPTRPGRPAGASAAGALDMLGNVAEWTDPGARSYTQSCVEAPPREAELLGGNAYDAANSPSFDRVNRIAVTPRWFENPEQGIRCARSSGQPAAPPTITDPALRAMIEGGALVVEPAADGGAAHARAHALCAAGKRAMPLAGELVGEHGWFVVIDGAPSLELARAASPPAAKVIAAPVGLQRLVGIATCGEVAERGKLRVTSGKLRWTIELASDAPTYQLWLPPATQATLELSCKRPGPKGECDFGMMITEPATLRIPVGPASGAEGPPLEASGGYVCD